ncbi:MAG: hypothetical protein LBD03_04200 [Methanobrevibacter sp.]|nr:hypothetical protein [Candidatus Methanovirga procula]
MVPNKVRNLGNEIPVVSSRVRNLWNGIPVVLNKVKNLENEVFVGRRQLRRRSLCLFSSEA